MIVVADTSPLNYLILIDEIELLPALYDRVSIPHTVFAELQRHQAPELVRAWAQSLPSWCEVHTVISIADPALARLDEGERDAIMLALESGIDTLLIDEIEGRREAVRKRLHVLGTIAILEKAAQRGWIDFRAAFSHLGKTSFRLSAGFATNF
ncbi:MAG TPA: hypothetical protein VGR47_23080 [Terracidiphilus sp.]|nr:hypothetical protein [Terracidiphilus sp.]